MTPTATKQESPRERRRRAVALGATAAAATLLLAGTGAFLASSRGAAFARRLAKAAARRLQGTAALAAVPQERAWEPLTIFADDLGNGWQDWSWAERDIRSEKAAKTGRRAIAMTVDGYKGIYLHHDPFDVGGYGSLEFWACAPDAPTGRKILLTVSVADAGGKFPRPVPVTILGGGEWMRVTVPFSDLNVAAAGGRISGVIFQDATGNRQGQVFFDDIRLLPNAALPAPPTQATVAVTVEPSVGRHTISPLIYGLAHLSPELAADLHPGADRWGGNGNSRYNWIRNTANAARDWEFRNRGPREGEKKPGEEVDDFVRLNRTAGAATVLTIPTLGWVAKDGDNNSRSLNVPPDGGPGLSGPDGPVPGYDPTENRHRTSVRSVARERDARPGEVAQDAWVRHLVQTHGDAAHGGVAIYAMDNEPDLWNSTHTDVHPARMGYDDVLAKFEDYAPAVKDADPTALVTGPVSWGWTGYQYSALDKGADNYRTHADRTAHGDTPFLPWFLRQVRAYDQKAGRRTLDILDVHYYPQADGVYSGRADDATRALRLRATRSLWDPSYSDESWIGEPVRLLPRLKEWIDAEYPGTRIGITEWNFGGDADISGGLAIAETLGIFGRENIYLANYWTYPQKGTPGYLAFRLYRNADGAGHGFGDTACAARTTAPDRLSCFAATDGKTGDLTLVLVNKMAHAAVTAPVAISGLEYSSAATTVYRVKAGDRALAAESGPRVTAGKLTVTLPPYSMVLVRVPRGAK